MQKRLTEQGLKFLEAGQFDKAAQVLTLLINSFPTNADAHHMLGIIELERGNFAAAYALVKAAIDLSPVNSIFYNTLGNIEMHRQQYAQAESAFLQAIEHDPEKIEYKYNLAHFYLAQNRFQKAIDFYYYILRYNPAHYLSIRGITVCYLFSNEPSIALEHANEWVKEFFSYDEPYYYLGLCHYALGNIPAALAAYDRGMSLNPNNFEILTAIGACYRALGNYAIAENYLLKSINLQFNNPTAMYNLASIHLDKGELDTARKLYVNASSLDPNYAEPICGLGYIELIEGRPNKALEFYARAQRIEPLNPKPLFLTATTLLRMQQFGSGWQAYKATLNTPTILENVAAWQGQRLSANDTLLLWYARENYDLGEQIMFASILQELRNLVNNVVVLCDKQVATLLKPVFPNYHFTHELNVHDLAAPFANITHQTPLNTLGQFFRQSFADFRHYQPMGYLKADSAQVNIYKAKYKGLFPGKKLIGIAFRAASNDNAINHVKSSTFNNWLPILDIPDCQTICLQPQFLPHDAKMYADPTNNLSELCAQMASLDLIFTVDNTVAHLAGALGLEVYTLLSAHADWYWFNDNDYSTWYPRMRLLRQQQANEWQELIMQLVEKAS